MVGKLLVRGMLIGILAGFLTFVFLKIVGEPQVDRAIAFETQLDKAKAEAAMASATAQGITPPMEEAEPELVSRPVQAGWGLLTGVMVYNVAFGGLFALVFAAVYGRIGRLDVRATAVVLALAGFVAVSVVPMLKYPANPPSVGDPDTIGMRTGVFFAMIAISLAAAIGAALLRGRLAPRHGGWTAALIALAFYVGVMIATAVCLPAINEVPDQFPAVVLWQFRMASLGAQALMWTTLGLGFGAWAERTLSVRSRTVSRALAA